MQFLLSVAKPKLKSERPPKSSHDMSDDEDLFDCAEMPSLEPPSYDTLLLMDLLKPLLDVKSRPQPALGSQLTSSRQSCYKNFGTHQKKLKKIEVFKKHNLFFC